MPEAEASASADFSADMSAEIAARDGGTSDDDIKAYASTAGAIGGAAACTALGAPAAAPLCGTIGGWIGGAVAGALLSVFGGADEAKERAKQFGRAAAWREYRDGLDAYFEAIDRMVYDTLTEFLRAHWADLRDAEVPGVVAGWGPAVFRSMFHGTDTAPQIGAFDAGPLGFQRGQLGDYYLCLDAAVPGVAEARSVAGGYVIDLPGSPGCVGTYGDSEQAAHAKCRERIEQRIKYLDRDVKAALIVTVGQWATVAGANRAARTSGQLPSDGDAAKKKTGSASKAIPALFVGGGILAVVLSRRRRA